MAKRMSSPKTALLKTKITLFFLTGTVLLIVGEALWAYTNNSPRSPTNPSKPKPNPAAKMAGRRQPTMVDDDKNNCL